jgi:hypothetical protein
MKDVSTAASNGTGGLGGNTKVIILEGNSTGTYSAPGFGASNRLLCGFSLRENLSSATFNFSSSAFNSFNGWYADAGQIIDPTANDWSGILSHLAL